MNCSSRHVLRPNYRREIGNHLLHRSISYFEWILWRNGDHGASNRLRKAVQVLISHRLRRNRASNRKIRLCIQMAFQTDNQHYPSAPRESWMHNHQACLCRMPILVGFKLNSQSIKNSGKIRKGFETSLVYDIGQLSTNPQCLVFFPRRASFLTPIQ